MANPKSVTPIREEGDVSPDELSAEERRKLDKEIADLHRQADQNRKAGH